MRRGEKKGNQQQCPKYPILVASHKHCASTSRHPATPHIRFTIQVHIYLPPLHLSLLHPSPLITSPQRFATDRPIIERVPTQRTSALITARKPLEKTRRVEQILARSAALVRHLLVAGDDAVADGAFRVALERADDVLSENGQPVGDRAVL